MSPWASITMPEPRPPEVSISTIEGSTAAIRAWYSACSSARPPVAGVAVPPAPGEAGGVGAALPAAREAVGAGACFISAGGGRPAGGGDPGPGAPPRGAQAAGAGPAGLTSAPPHPPHAWQT